MHALKQKNHKRGADTHGVEAMLEAFVQHLDQQCPDYNNKQNHR